MVTKQSKQFIFALVDPRSLEWKYISKTINGRVDALLYRVDRYNQKRKDWFDDLNKHNLKPQILILEYVSDVNKLDLIQREWINECLRVGIKLTNKIDFPFLLRTKKGIYTARDKAKKRKLVDIAKNKPCVDCGVKYPPYIMEFDHLRDKKIRSISEMVGRHMASHKIKKEIAKCDLVCSLCHRNRTHFREKDQIRSTTYQGNKRRLGREFIQSRKMDPCVDCGKKYNPWQMDFDHKDDSVKKYNISKMCNLSHSTIIKEISKCDLVCANCHRERTNIRGQY